MALPATDPFTGSNGTLLPSYSANWASNGGDLQIQSNAYAPNTSTTEIGARWTADAFNNDQYSQSTLVAKEGTADYTIGVGVRHAAAATKTYYGYYADGDATSYIFKEVAGTWTQLGATLGGVSVGVVMRLEVSGTTLTAKLDGVTQTTRSDSSISSGVAGLTGYNTTAAQRADNWEGGNVSAGGGSTLVARRALLGVGL